MDLPGRRRPTAALFALFLVTGAVAAGVVGGETPPEERRATVGAGPTHAVTSPGGFASDAAAARALGPPRTAVEATVGPAGGHASAAGTDAVLAGAPRNIEATHRFAPLPDRPGEVRVTQSYRVRDSVTALETAVPADATVAATNGFDATGGRGYEWDGETAAPSITYALDVNETEELAGPEGAAGEYLFADAGEWALFRRPESSVSWGWRGGDPVGLRRTTTTEGPGYTGERMVYLGAVDTRRRTAHGQTVTLVVPRRADMAESPDAVLDALADAADRLRVGDRDENLSVFAAPTGSVGWGVRGLQYGDSDAWVRDSEPLEGPDDTWLHEYVHTRQSFETAPSGEWVTEATATYYAALLALERDRTDYPSFREFLGRGATPPQSEAVLTEPGSWANAANYWKGALVAAAIDRRIRLATDGERSLGTVFTALNARTEPVDRAATLEAVGAAGGSDPREFARTYTATERVPDQWSAEDHAAAFDSTPARFTYRFGPADQPGERFRVTGSYRNVTVGDPPVALYTGETLRVTGVVTNAGGASADYEEFFTVGGRVRATVAGSLAPGETATHEFSHTFRSSGERELTFGSDAVAVEVYDTATASVADVRANRTVLDRPGAVRLAIDVTNRFDAAAERNLTVTRDGQRVTTARVALGPGENRTVTVHVRLDDPGEHTLAVEGVGSVTVTVGDGTSGEGGASGDGSGEGTSVLGPGFGPMAALFALVAVVLATVARRRR